MIQLRALIKRNTKLFFRDKGLFFTSLITPVILLVLYATFLGNIYKDSVRSALPEGFRVADNLMDGFVGGQLISSILAVSCVTVAFCCNLLMVQDKATGVVRDLTMAPVKGATLALGYYASTLISTLIVCFSATGICLVYVGITGWYLTVADVLLLLLDVFLLVLFGTALSSVINFFLSSQGQISAVGSIVSAGYGFLCGAYMPISQFSQGLQNVILFLPGTYGTSLVRYHALDGVFSQMEREGFPSETIEALKDSVDCNLYFFGDQVEWYVKYAVLGGAIALLIAIYILMQTVRGNKRSSKV